MGRIRIHEIKKASFELIGAYPDKFTGDFAGNKKSLLELGITQEKRTVNKIAGYITRIGRHGSRTG